jgi:hypothetical protein
MSLYGESANWTLPSVIGAVCEWRQAFHPTIRVGAVQGATRERKTTARESPDRRGRLEPATAGKPFHDGVPSGRPQEP